MSACSDPHPHRSPNCAAIFAITFTCSGRRARRCCGLGPRRDRDSKPPDDMQWIADVDPIDML